ncbi:hypothetical protein V3C99_017976, partial [Haemonchus contortus]
NTQSSNCRHNSSKRVVPYSV